MDHNNNMQRASSKILIAFAYIECKNDKEALRALKDANNLYKQESEDKPKQILVGFPFTLSQTARSALNAVSNMNGGETC